MKTTGDKLFASSISTTRAGGFCRDCLELLETQAKRCQNCGSPRLLWHNELYSLTISHIDCDAFFATIEKRDNPNLKNKPVIIGGGHRGVVSTACYLARIKGVHSAMPMFKALEACPDAVVVKPDLKKYSLVGRQVKDMMKSLTPLVEPLSIDEAFLDLSGTEQLHKAPAALTLAKFARRVEQELGISVSIGLSHNKFLAKIASDLNKPRGFSVIGEEETTRFMAQQPLSVIWGVGKATQTRLKKDGIQNIADLQAMDASVLAKRYGSMGVRLAQLAWGRDKRPVKIQRAAKSVSAETTFSTDLKNRNELAPILRQLSEKVSKRLKEKQIAGQTIVLKLKTAEFKSRTRNRKLTNPTQLVDKIFSIGHEMLLKELDGTTKFRLIGIGVSDLQDDTQADPFDLLEPEAGKRAKLERAVDNVRDKFGDKIVETGLTFTHSSKIKS